MSDFNRVFLMGRIGNDLELQTSAQGQAYVKISLATNSKRKNKNSSEPSSNSTYWHRVIAFGNQAENCAKYLHKGSQVMIEGSLEVRTYTNDESQKITSVSVLADRVNFLGGKFAAAVSPDLDSIASQ